MSNYLALFTVICLSLFISCQLQSCPALPHPIFLKALDVQGHRGGKGYEPQNTLWSYANGIQIGVNTLEMDMHITKDNYTVMSHDHYINTMQCHDTKPAFTNDPQFPYAGKYIVNLTYAQILTLDCGYNPGDVPYQVIRPGTHLPLFSEVIELVQCYNQSNILLNTEIKYNADMPNTTASREVFVDQVGKVLEKYNFGSRVTIQSFDWTSLVLFKKRYPDVITVALVDETTFIYGSNWLNGINIQDPVYSGSLVKMANTTGASILSPIDGFKSTNASATVTANTTGYYAFTRKEVVDEAHAYGMKVVPWTVNDAYTIQKLINDGVDGIIGNYPILIRQIAQQNGYQVHPLVPLNPSCKVF